MHAYSRRYNASNHVRCKIFLKCQENTYLNPRPGHEFDRLHSPISPRPRRPQGIIRHHVCATILDRLTRVHRGGSASSTKGLGVTVQALSAGLREDKLSDKACQMGSWLSMSVVDRLQRSTQSPKGAKGDIIERRLSITAAPLVTGTESLSPDLEWRGPDDSSNRRVSVFVTRRKVFSKLCIACWEGHRCPGERSRSQK